LQVEKQTHSNQEGPTKVVTVSVYQEIQRCKQFGKGKAATSRELHLARGTVRKFWHMSDLDYAAFCAGAARREQRFDAYRSEIIELIEINLADAHHVYVSSVYDVLEERHGALPGTQRTLGNYIRMLRETGAVETRPSGRVWRPQATVSPGDQCQVDFGQQRISASETAYIFVVVLALSRARYVAVQDHPFHTIDVIRHLLASFAYFGGRPRRLVIDQDKLMTVSENGGEVVHTVDFQHFLDEQHLEIWLCRKHDPQSKGKVENAVKFVKTSFFSARRFTTVEEVHTPLAQWLTRRANGRICQATGRVPAVVLENEERPALRPVRPSIYDSAGTVGGDTRKADAKAMISFGGNRYSVPAEYAGTTVCVAATATHLLVRDRATGEHIARHRIPAEKSQTIVASQRSRPRVLRDYWWQPQRTTTPSKPPFSSASRPTATASAISPPPSSTLIRPGATTWIRFSSTPSLW